ncbi:MAG: hypothetical protein ACXWPM_01845 [Bdellovibrionota bacterium]
MLCRSGLWKGAYGPVEVTGERLQRIADRYNKQRAKPQNENDFAPVLVNHQRDADLVMGRVMADLTVEDFVDPETGAKGKALYGTLRIDDPEAIKKVETGKYSQLSLSFDEDDDEFYEESFVAVEAARRSQALNQGDKEMSVELQAQLNKANENHQALQARLRTSVEVRRAVSLAFGENLTAAERELVSLASELDSGLKEAKTALLKSQFKGLIREGRLSKAEFDKLEMVKLAAMPADALKLLMGSYKDRPVSAHVQQFGQTGAQPTAPGKMSAAQMREAIKLQREGKSVQLDAADGDPEKKKDPKAKKPGEQEQAGGEGDADMDDFEGALKKMGEVEPIVNRAKDFMKKMSESLKKMSEQNDKDAA